MADESFDFFSSEVSSGDFDVSDVPMDSAGDMVDETIQTSSANVVAIGSGSKRRSTEGDAKSGPPRVDEWQDFFSRVVLGFITDGYINYVFRDVDENLLTEREIDRLKLADGERNLIAKPFAELANKLKFTRKHGRTIIAASGSAESAWTLALWFGRVNRIAMKHRPNIEGRGKVKNERTRSGPQSQNTSGPASNGHGSYTIYQPGTG